MALTISRSCTKRACASSSAVSAISDPSWDFASAPILSAVRSTSLPAEEDLLVAVLLDPFANLVERVEDHIDIGPVGGTRDDQRHPLDFRLLGGFAVVLLQELSRLEDSTCFLRPDARARPGCRDEGVACLDLVAFCRRLAHHLNGADDLAQLQETDLRLFQGSLGDLRSVVGFCQRADLVGGAVDLLAECHLAPLQDRGEPVREWFDFSFETGSAQ